MRQVQRWTCAGVVLVAFATAGSRDRAIAQSAGGHGATVGGYGEMHGEWRSGESELALDRFVLLVGDEITDAIHLYSEIEIEDVKEAEVEQAYLEFALSPAVQAEAGLVLVPISRTNLVHEPTTYVPIQRPLLDRIIVPTTWREPGVGVSAHAGDALTASAYVLDGLDAHGFTAATGILEGRQEGAKAKAHDVAIAGRVVWSPLLGAAIAASGYTGGAAQGDSTLGGVRVTMLEADVEIARAGWSLRGEVARGTISHAAEIGAVTGETVGSRLTGYTIEAGYDVLGVLAPRHTARLTPFVRLDRADPQAGIPAGAMRTPGVRVTALTYGLAFKPADGVALKGDIIRATPIGERTTTTGELGLAFLF